MRERAAAGVLAVLAGCYVTARGGPSYGFDGTRRGTSVEVLVGVEAHLGPGGMQASPIGRRLAIYNSLGFKQAPAAGADREGAIYEIGGAAFLPLRERKRGDAPGVATLVRADVSGAIGGLAGLEGSTNVGTIVRAMGLVGLEQYWDGWAVRAGGGIMLESVVVEERMPNPQKHEGSYAPVGAVTVEFTPLVVRMLRSLFGH